VHLAESDYGLIAGQHALLPEGKGKGKVTAKILAVFLMVCLELESCTVTGLAGTPR